MKRIFMAFLSAVLLLPASCGGAGTVKSPSDKPEGDEYTKYDAELTQRIKQSDGGFVAYDGGGWELVVDKSSAEVSVRHKPSGALYSTNPAGRADDGIASGAYMDELNAQALIQYADHNDKYFNMNTYSDSVALDQVTFAKIENGIRVNYTLGKVSRTYLIPFAMKADRFEAFLKNADAVDAEMLRAYYSKLSLSVLETDADKALYKQEYPALALHDLYVLTGMKEGDDIPPMLLEEIEGYFTRNGYTRADLDRDRKENLLESRKNEDVSIRFSIEYSLQNGDLVATLPHGSIAYDPSLIILTNISFLPYFGAAGTGDRGYMLVPDGSGALIDLNNGKTTAGRYSKRIYGPDYSIERTQLEYVDDSQIYMPVFGMKKADTAFLGIIESGAAYASINADISGKNNSYNVIFPSFTLKEQAVQTDTVINISGRKFYQKQDITDDFSVRYRFLGKDDADYVGMARIYQRYLIENGDLPDVDSKPAFHFSATAASNYTTNIFGVQVKKQKSLTSYAQLQEMLEELKRSGVKDIAAHYYAWSDGAAENRLADKARPISELGGKSGFKELLKYTGEHNVDFYPDVDFMYVSQYDKLFEYSKNKLSARSITNQPSYFSAYRLSTLQADEDKRKAIVSPLKYKDTVDRFLKSFGEYKSAGLGASTLGNGLVSDFNEKGSCLRQQSIAAIRSRLEEISDRGYKVSVDGANIFALKNASLINGLAMGSSGHYLFDRDVPFMQMVLHGYVPYTSVPINLSSDPRETVLKIFETGTIPSYHWIYEPNIELKETDSDRQYNSNFENWKQAAVSLYKEFIGVYGGIRDQAMTGHTQIARDVFLSRYGDFAVYVNYGSEDAAVPEGIVPARSYLPVKGDGGNG